MSSLGGFQQPRPALSSQQQTRYSPAPDYVDTTNARRSLHIDTTGRLPLREGPNGHVPQSFSGGIVPCYQSPVGLSPSSSSHMQPNSGGIPPPIVPSQSFDCLYRNDPMSRHQARFQQQQQRRNGNHINPLYFWPAFKQYRNRQAHKDTQKDKGGVWRRTELEDAFVDSVLLMPHMGRRKFSMGGKLHGRNMLISEYIFVICVAVLGSKEIFRIDNSNDSIEQMGRKQVSSHMQVVKKFFEDLRCFHFLFPSEEKREPGTTHSDDFYEDEEQESFKANPVLTALAEGRVPDVKPNYEYFSQLLQLQSSIMIRPKTCEIFVSSPNVKIRDDVAYDVEDQALDITSFPHLNKYMHCDDTPHVLGKDVLLHEYTRPLDRTTSACVKSVTRRWQRDAPAMYNALDLPTRDKDCLLLEMCTTLDLHEHAKFPFGSELTGFVEVTITQPQLQNHRWKCITKLTRPPELQSDDNKSDIYTIECGIHRRGCSDSRPDCDCHTRPRQDIHVPFPAVEWATILSTAASYPDVEHQRKKDKRGKTGGDKPPLDRTSSKRKRSEDEGDADAWGGREPTGSDLICKVAMYQELWSCAPDSNRWTRQAIVFWRFVTTNQWYKYHPVFRPAGTTWRWLTINDPMSRYHQQKALVHPSGLPRDSIMSPSPSIGQHLTATMNETFNTWDSGMGQVPHSAGPTTGNMSFLDNFSSGLATPPPTASLHGSYSSGSSFDTAHANVNFLPTTCGPDNSQTAALAQSHSFYDGHAGSGFGDVKPMPTSLSSYMPSSAPGSLDLSSQGIYDQSNTHGLGHHTGSQPSMTGWDMPSMNTWGPTPSTNTPAASATSDWGAPPVKVEQPDMWGSVQWGQAPTPGGAGHQDLSPRPMKRRRADGLEVNIPPVNNVW